MGKHIRVHIIQGKSAKIQVAWCVYWPLIMLALLPHYAVSQARVDHRSGKLNMNYDSLEGVISTLADDSQKVDAINVLVMKLRESDNIKSLKLSNEAVAISEKLSYQKGLAQALENIGWIYYRKANFKESLRNSLRAYDLSRQIGDSVLIANCLNNLGAVEYEQKHYNKAIVYFKSGYDVASDIRLYGTVFRSLINLSFSYLALEKLDSAEHFSLQAIEISELAQERFRLGMAYRNLGDILVLRGRPEEALTNFNTCLAAAEAADNTSLIASVLHRMARTLIALGRYDEAAEKAKRNIELCTKFGLNDPLESSYFLLSQVYEKKNMMKEAYSTLRQYLVVHDSVMAMKNEQQLGLIEMEFNMKQKESEIEYLRRDAEIQSNQLFWQRVVIAVFAVIFLIVMWLIVMLRKQNRNVNQANENLAQKNKTISNQSEELLATIDKLHITQAQLLHAEKMASLGVLTAGIAHELNNPLNFIFGGTQALSYTHQELKDEVEKGDHADHNKMMSIIQDLKSLETSISNGVARTTEIINSMRTFSGPQTGLPEDFTVHISECVESTLVLMASKLKDANVNIVRDFAPVAKVRVNTSQINQCILNLLDNAIDALEHTEGDKRITIRIFSQQGSTLVSITDNGIGIPAEIQPRVMEAFFTTKAPGRGTGLGLFICYSIIQQHNGELTFASTPGGATTFTISLPTGW